MGSIKRVPAPFFTVAAVIGVANRSTNGDVGPRRFLTERSQVVPKMEQKTAICLEVADKLTPRVSVLLVICTAVATFHSPVIEAANAESQTKRGGLTLMQDAMHCKAKVFEVSFVTI